MGEADELGTPRDDPHRRRLSIPVSAREADGFDALRTHSANVTIALPAYIHHRAGRRRGTDPRRRPPDPLIRPYRSSRMHAVKARP